jgi:hypothetical protein
MLRNPSQESQDMDITFADDDKSNEKDKVNK